MVKTSSKYDELRKIIKVSADGKIVGYLDLRGTQVTQLPDNLTVGGYLDLRGAQITQLPDNLTVGGSLYLSGAQVTQSITWKISKQIGSRHDFSAYNKSQDVVHCGCFRGSLQEFTRRVNKVYRKGSVHGLEYNNWIAEIK